ncbi:Glycosyl transferase [Acidilobus saccharovorans 345-15]|uniref:Glycosyl transferase n=1 Tax=Acidilobus saccharovorans (strain DSM 16705 / JCM 18335 / VKM B-2471 / 345-15) TaxID=666510 RepID=D9Q1A2_ACIS3|nr:glycosyltransferase family A protein [Acidilobus saccharovorans]ADL19090.1 Glycosyl transferase [Acidilobus saccharovorans 345-15]
MSSGELISVIVTAHNRKQYLPYALRSLEAQTLPRDRFEVIVVKNFDDKESDEIILRNGWKNIITDVVPLGGKIAIGLEEARGDVVTFLEDDDMYFPERLSVVYKAFADLPGLIYLHNGQEVIDEGGSSLGPLQGLSHDVVIPLPPTEVACYAALVNPGGFHNNSSIAARRHVLEGGPLRYVRSSPDLAALASALRRGRGLLLLMGRPLTYWRVHTGATTSHSYSSRSGDMASSLRALARSYYAWALDAHLVKSYLAGTPCERYVEHLEAFRAVEIASMPSWAAGQRLTVTLYRRLRQAQALRRLGSVSARNYLVMVADSLMSKAPDRLRELYWKARWLAGGQ